MNNTFTNRPVTMNENKNLLEIEEHMYILDDVKKPNVFRNMFPYSEIPKIPFNDRTVPHDMPKDIWITDTTFRDGQQSRAPYSTEQIVTKGITLVPEGRRVFPDMTVAENLKIGAYMRKDSLDEDMNWVYDLFPRLKERSWQLAGTLSGGEQQMLAIGRALMSRPEIIMMDEPSLGLAPIIVKGVFDIIREINKQGVTILLVEQNANMALKAANLGYVMETGRITLSGTGAELLENEAVKAAYLGKANK